jgi:hypothetical protein
VKKTPLSRKVNTKARGVHHRHGGDYRHIRNSKQQEVSEAQRQPMSSKVQRGLDYTPLFRFLLSKVGQPWSEIFSEAVARLDHPTPLYWMVALNEAERQDYVRMGESSYYSGLYVDDDGLLQIVNPDIGPASLAPQCKCCTHTFNGVRFTRVFGRSA